MPQCLQAPAAAQGGSGCDVQVRLSPLEDVYLGIVRAYAPKRDGSGGGSGD